MLLNTAALLIVALTLLLAAIQIVVEHRARATSGHRELVLLVMGSTLYLANLAFGVASPVVSLGGGRTAPRRGSRVVAFEYLRGLEEPGLRDLPAGVARPAPARLPRLYIRRLRSLARSCRDTVLSRATGTRIRRAAHALSAILVLGVAAACLPRDADLVPAWAAFVTSIPFMSTLPPFALGGHAPVSHRGGVPSHPLWPEPRRMVSRLGAGAPRTSTTVGDGRSRLGRVDLPVMPPVQPMLAKAVKGVPDPEKFGGLSFEPKWDGFRAIVFRDGDEVEFTSRNTKPLTRYFPELVEAALEQLPERCVLDGEIFVAIGRAPGVRDAAGADPSREVAHRHARREDAGQLRGVRPARARRHVVRRPAVLRAPGRARGAARRAERAVLPDPHHRRPGDGREWFEQFEGAGLDGVIAKPLPAPYAPNGRTMMKIKHERTADVVLAGYREHKTSTPEQPLLGSLLLGLYADGKLQHVGVSAQLHRGPAGRADRGAAAAGLRHQGPPLGRVGGVGDRQPRPGPRHPEPLEPGQGPQLHRRCVPSG